MNQIGTLAANIWDNEFGDENSELEREMEVEGISGQLEAGWRGCISVIKKRRKRHHDSNLLKGLVQKTSQEHIKRNRCHFIQHQ